MAAARDDGDDGFAREVLEHLDAVYNVARHLSGARGAADDLAQETYARAFAARERFVVGTNAKAWLLRILRNAWVDGARREKRSPVRASGDGRTDDTATDRAPAGSPPEGAGADLEAALAALSDDARAVILLDVEGLSEVEIADVMGCAQGTVKSRLSRARAALRERLKDYGR